MCSVDLSPMLDIASALNETRKTVFPQKTHWPIPCVLYVPLPFCGCVCGGVRGPSEGTANIGSIAFSSSSAHKVFFISCEEVSGRFHIVSKVLLWWISVNDSIYNKKSSSFCFPHRKHPIIHDDIERAHPEQTLARQARKQLESVHKYPRSNCSIHCSSSSSSPNTQNQPESIIIRDPWYLQSAK
jgi:hypothetical protein